MTWRHAIISTRCSWLHGDPRGFRSRDNQLHSSGDYKNPPPPDEHAGLHKYHQEHSQPEVHIPYAEQATVGKTIVKFLESEHYKVIAVAVTKVHAHVLVELPHAITQVKQIFGNVKRHSSRAIRKTVPGSVWGAGGKFKPVVDQAHCKNAHDYIIYDQGANAWTWSFRDINSNGVYGRRRP